MTEYAEARLFMHGRSQAVRLPKAFRMPGDRVRVRRVGRGVMLEPTSQTRADFDAIFDALDAYRDIPFIPEGREQPPMPSSDEITFDR